MKKTIHIMLMAITLSVMTGFAYAQARDVGPPENTTATIIFNDDFSFDVTTIKFTCLDADPAVADFDDVVNADPAAMANLAEYRYSPAFIDRHRRTSGSENESYENNTRFITTAFIDRHRR